MEPSKPSPQVTPHLPIAHPPKRQAPWAGNENASHWRAHRGLHIGITRGQAGARSTECANERGCAIQFVYVPIKLLLWSGQNNC